MDRRFQMVWMSMSVLLVAVLGGCGGLSSSREPMPLSGAMEQAGGKRTRERSPNEEAQDTTRSISRRGAVEREGGERKKADAGHKRATEDYAAGTRREGGATAVEVGVGVAGDGSPSSIGEGEGERGRWYVGFVLGGGTLPGKELSGFSLGGLKGGGLAEGGRVRFEVQGLVGGSNLRESGSLGASIENEFSLGWALAAQVLLTPPKTFMGLYLLGGLRTSYLFWDYANIVHVSDADGERDVEQDILKYYEFYAGLGCSLAQFEHGQIGINISGGYRVYSGATDEGFSNDVFDDEGFAQIMLDVVFGRLR